jgi:hypothetical protein
MPYTQRRARTPPGAIFRSMALLKGDRFSVAALVALMSAAALGAYASSATARTPTAKTQTSKRALLQSRQLWATIDVCNAPDQPSRVGVRGSMPGDGQAGDTMYMRFRLQYLSSTTKHWVDLTTEANSGYVAVGRGKSTRQGGNTFQLIPVPGRPAFILRGVVSFQWRRGATIVATAARGTTAGRHSLAGADPAGFSAATCAIG